MTNATYRPRFEVTARLENPSTDDPHQVIGLSRSTVSFACPEPPGIGTEVDVVIHLPALRSSLHARGQVAWRNRQEPADLGVKLDEVDAAGRELHARYLQLVLAASAQG